MRLFFNDFASSVSSGDFPRKTNRQDDWDSIAVVDRERIDGLVIAETKDFLGERKRREVCRERKREEENGMSSLSFVF